CAHVILEAVIVAIIRRRRRSMQFFLSATATPEIYTLSLHDALPILTILISTYLVTNTGGIMNMREKTYQRVKICISRKVRKFTRSEEHTSELQSGFDLVCRLLLEKQNHKEHTGRSHRCR